MFDHDRFEELASLAALGELSPEEHEEFERHKVTCAQCREVFERTTSVAAGLFLAGSPHNRDAGSDGESHRRLRAAISRQLPHVVPRSVMERYRHFMAAAVASAFVFGGGIGVTVAYKARLVNNRGASVKVRAATNPRELKSLAVPSNEEAQRQALLADLERRTEEDRREARELRDRLTASDQHAVELQGTLDETKKQSTEQEVELIQVRNELATIHDQLARAEKSASDREAKITALEYTLADRESRLAEVTASVEREREMLSEGREVRDIMGARDLHIVDVIDRDGRGRPQKAFGRAFYTQGKSLIFYAFDLPTKSTAGGRFVYAAWGSNSNNLNSKVAHSLGIFYNDDQTQHRWAMKFDDTKILDEIDTVFVTLEPAGKPFSAPTGKPLLEAYFGTPPNHP